MATLLYGGAFNPITVAHLLTAREAMERGGFDEVIFIPTGYEGYKGGIAPFTHRLAMLKHAIHGQSGFEISECEGEFAKTGSRCYTIDTYRHMRDTTKKDVWWLIGSDNLPKIAKWRNFEAIKQEMKFVVLPRPGHIGDHIKDQPSSACEADLRIFGMQGRAVEAPLLEISSTYVRDRLKAGKSIKYLVPEGVEQYINAHGLYKGD